MKTDNLPNNWKTVKLGEVCDIIGGYAFDSSKMKDSGMYQIIKMGNIYHNTLDLERAKSFIDEIGEKERNYILLNNDILITLTGTVGKKDYGYSVIIKCDKSNLLCNQRLALLRAKNALPYFLFLQVHTKKFLDSFFDTAKGGTGNQTNVSINSLRNLTIHLPPLPEQTRIATCLSVWDEGIEKLKKLITAKKKLKKGLMQRLLSPNNPLKGFENVEWKSVRLGEICEIKKGEQLNRLDLTEKGDYPCLNGGILASGYTNKWNTEEDTITISEGGNSCGYVNFNKTKFWAGGHCYVLKNLKCEKLFLYQELKNKEKSIMRMRVGSGLPNIQKLSIMEFRLNLPPLPIQQKIASILSKTDEEINLLNKKLCLIEKQKKGLMQILLSGKVRFKEFI